MFKLKDLKKAQKCFAPILKDLPQKFNEDKSEYCPDLESVSFVIRANDISFKLKFEDSNFYTFWLFSESDTDCYFLDAQDAALLLLLLAAATDEIINNLKQEKLI